jgi:hypothetical protein
MNEPMTAPITLLRAFALIGLLALASPAQALDVVFPAGSRIGLAPPSGVAPSRNFVGFEDPRHEVAIVITALPPETYEDVQQSTTAGELQKHGLIFEKRETLTHADGKAFLVIASQDVDKVKLHKWIFAVGAADLTALVTMQVPDAAQEAYPEAAIRAALASVTIRSTVPQEEQLSLLPFRVGALAQFRLGGVIAGRAVMLTDAANDALGPGVDPHIVVAIAPGGPEQADRRDDFARDLFSTIPNLKDLRVNSSEPLRIGGQPGHQIVALAKDARSGKDVTVVQWVRFGNGAYLHLIGVAPTDAWIAAYARFREVRDGIEPR